MMTHLTNNYINYIIFLILLDWIINPSSNFLAIFPNSLIRIRNKNKKKDSLVYFSKICGKYRGKIDIISINIVG
jgi:hypothetical protein